nr:MAG TPA: hypothetical protein [Caudoviricetes sp.]
MYLCRLRVFQFMCFRVIYTLTKEKQRKRST